MNKSVTTLSGSITYILLAAFTMAMVVAGGATQAASPEALTKVVRYSDLNLESAEGAQTLYQRLRGAAKDVCAPFETRELARRRVWQNCVDTSLSRAVMKINRPMLSALHESTINHLSTG